MPFISPGDQRKCQFRTSNFGRSQLASWVSRWREEQQIHRKGVNLMETPRYSDSGGLGVAWALGGFVKFLHSQG